jgi:tetratricopeptide (TPR) repeat protein
MRLVTKTRVALAVSLPLVALLAYALGTHLWSRHHYRAAEEALDRRDLADAGAHLEKYLAVSPHDLTARLTAARTARRRHDYDEARRHLSLFTRDNGPTEAVELELQLLWAQQGDLTEAARLLTFCEDHPDDQETPLQLEAAIEGSLVGLAEPYSAALTYGGGRWEGYLARVRRGADLWLRLRTGRADQVEGRVWRAQAEVYANDLLEAKVDVGKALELDADHFGARLQMAFLLEQEAPAEAAVHLELLLARQPDNERVRFELAEVQRGLGHLDEASDLLDALLASNPDHLHALLTRGRVAMEAEPPQPKEAERWLRRALALAPDDPEVNLGLADCLRMTPDRASEAADYRDRFIRLDAERARRARSPAPPGP